MYPQQQIANYDPYAAMVAQQTYAATGMGGVTPPEALIAGEAYARGAGQFAGMGAAGPPPPAGGSMKKGLIVCATGVVVGFVGGFFLGRWIYSPDASERQTEQG